MSATLDGVKDQTFDYVIIGIYVLALRIACSIITFPLCRRRRSRIDCCSETDQTLGVVSGKLRLTGLVETEGGVLS